MTIKSPAKINLHLAVLERRNDGFHNLESVFLAVDFADTLHFEPLPRENALEIAMKWASGADLSLPAGENIIFRAVSLFREKTGFNHGFKISVEKRIPMGGGLGGGSSNAASTLLALNRISGLGLPQSGLLEMAALLGSDVPFFIYETPAALVTGRGECIKSLKAAPWSFVLVNPGFHSSTAAAFKLLDEHRKGHFTPPSPLPLLLNESSLKNYYNDFLQVFGEPEKTAFNNIISQLQELGANYANLSGSGSICFGVFTDKTRAQEAAVSLRRKWDFVETCNISHCE